MNNKFILSKKTLSKLLEYINIITKTEVSINFKSQGWIIQVANSPIYTSIIDIRIPKSSFLEYNLETQKRISINYSNLYKLSKSFSENITIELSEFQISFYNQDSPKNRLVLAMLDSNFQPISLDLEFSSEFSVNLNQYNLALNNIGKLSNRAKVSFDTDNSNLIIQGEDNYSKGSLSWSVPIIELKNVSQKHVFHFTLNNQITKFIKITSQDAIIKYNEFYVFQINVILDSLNITSTFSLIESD
jgi:hypothetical protein